MAAKQGQATGSSTGPSFLKGQAGNVAEVRDAGYPGLLWYNGRPAFKKLGGVQAFGGFVVKAKQVGENFPVGNLIEYTYADGTSEEVYDIGPAQMAVIANRLDWFFGSKTKPEWVPNYQQRGDVKAKARNRYLVLLRGTEGILTKPLMITLFGVNGLMFHKVYNDFLKTVHAAGEKMAGQKLDAYTFWMHVVPGPFEKASQAFDSMINPPKLSLELPGPGGTVVKWNDKSPDEFLEAAYIGESNMQICAEWWDEAKKWRTEAITNKPANNGAAADEPTGIGDTLDLTGGDDDLPF